MGFSVVAPPGDEKKLAEAGQELLVAGAELGFNLEPEGFLYAWVGDGTRPGIRVLVDRNADGKIVGMLLMSCGQRWLHNDFTAHVLAVHGANRDGLVEYARNIAAALGAVALFVEDPAPVHGSNGDAKWTVYEHRLQ